VKTQIMTFPIKKRILTELFIDEIEWLYIQNERRDCIKKISDLSEEGRILAGK